MLARVHQQLRRGGQAQSLALSRDGGLSWQPYDGNPVLDRGTTDFRDPKVFAHTDAAGQTCWVMVVVEAVDRQVLVYRSPTCAPGTHVSTFGPDGLEAEGAVVWECPDLFPLPLDGDPAHVWWVLTWSINPIADDADPRGSSMRYLAGRLRRHTFVPATDVPEPRSTPDATSMPA